MLWVLPAVSLNHMSVVSVVPSSFVDTIVFGNVSLAPNLGSDIFFNDEHAFGLYRLLLLFFFFFFTFCRYLPNTACHTELDSHHRHVLSIGHRHETSTDSNSTRLSARWWSIRSPHFFSSYLPVAAEYRKYKTAAFSRASIGVGLGEVPTELALHAHLLGVPGCRGHLTNIPSCKLHALSF